MFLGWIQAVGCLLAILGSVVPRSQILLLLWCDKLSWFCHLDLNNFQSSAGDTSITSFHYFLLANTKMSKNKCSTQFSNVTAKLGLRFLEMVGDPDDSVSSCSIFIACPHSDAFLWECVQTNKWLSSYTLYLMNLGEQQELVFTPKARRGWGPKLDLNKVKAFIHGFKIGVVEFWFQVCFAALCLWDSLSKSETALWLLCRLTMTGTSRDICPSRHIWALFDVQPAEKDALG